MNDQDFSGTRSDQGPEDVPNRRRLSVRYVLRHDDRAPVDAPAAVLADPDVGADSARVLGVRPTEPFRCERLACTIAPASCTARHERAKRDAAIVHPRALTTLHGSPCYRCPIGIELAEVFR